MFVHPPISIIMSEKAISTIEDALPFSSLKEIWLHWEACSPEQLKKMKKIEDDTGIKIHY